MVNALCFIVQKFRADKTHCQESVIEFSPLMEIKNMFRDQGPHGLLMENSLKAHAQVRALHIVRIDRKSLIAGSSLHSWHRFAVTIYLFTAVEYTNLSPHLYALLAGICFVCYGNDNSPEYKNYD